MSTTVILGGGMGGMATAARLRQLAPRDHRIVLVERRAQFVAGASLTAVMLGNARPDAVTHTRAALQASGVELLQAEIESIDPAARSVRTTQGVLQADDLVIALGAELDPAAIPGMAEAHHFYDLDAATRLRDALGSFTGREIALVVQRSPFKCPPAPYEAALLLADRFKGRARVSLYTPEPAPMPSAGPTMGEFLRGELARAGVNANFLKPCTEVRGGRELTFKDGSTASCDLLICVPAHRAPAVVSSSGLADASGWIPADPATLATKFPRVWALGDVTTVPLPGRFKPEAPLVMPKAGIFAEGQGRAVAEQIAARENSRFDGTGFCFIELGRGRAVRGDGAFYATPAPAVRPADEPSAAAVSEKREWVRGWLERQLKS